MQEHILDASSLPQVSGDSIQLERIRSHVFTDALTASAQLAQGIAQLIRGRAAAGQKVVLGLATGSTPVKVYQELIRMHREEALSFQNVITFNLDEYYGLEATHPESYRRFMREQLFDHIDIPKNNTYVPDGTVPRKEVYAFCQHYEKEIRRAGGIDLQILGIGRTGHVGFNEPGSSVDSRTRMVTLDSLTRRDAARDFLGEANVPRHAITMGIRTILEARHVVLLAWGRGKASVVHAAVEEAPTESLPASLLQRHANCQFLLDPEAAADLTRYRYPWLVEPVDWSPAMVRRAVVWLAGRAEKPILKLLEEDYTENCMADLLTEKGHAYGLNIEVFNSQQHTITGWPGGKPQADDSNRPERAEPYPKRVLVLSPEPQDDIVGLGGTISRLVDQKHQVTIAYQTSGNLAVPDTDVQRTMDLLEELCMAPPRAAGETLSDNPRTIKATIRRSEALSAGRAIGLAPEQLRFLNLPFYENGRYRQFRLQEEDVRQMQELLEQVQPHEVFATGLDADPSAVSSLCFAAFQKAWERCASSPWRKDCWVWLYRQPENALDLHEVDMAVPLSPIELRQKLQGILQHSSQRNQSPMVPHGESADPWQQAELSNREAAANYDALGLAEYEALETFSRWA